MAKLKKKKPDVKAVCDTCTRLRRQLKGLRARNILLVRRAQRDEALLAGMTARLKKLAPDMPEPRPGR
jgi:hypothetical protein